MVFFWCCDNHNFIYKFRRFGACKWDESHSVYCVFVCVEVWGLKQLPGLEIVFWRVICKLWPEQSKVMVGCMADITSSLLLAVGLAQKTQSPSPLAVCGCLCVYVQHISKWRASSMWAWNNTGFCKREGCRRNCT